jgi:hypothetical protein
MPAPPAPPPPSIIRDEINKVEQVPVVNPDGSITYITRALPLTAEEQAERDQLNGIMQDALSEIKRLASSGYQEDEDTKRILDQWQAAQADIIGDSVTGRTRAEEDALARRGLADSSVGIEVRRKRNLDALEARQSLATERGLLSRDVRNERMAQQRDVYALASDQRNLAQAQQLQAAFKGQSAAAAINAQRNASLLDYYNAASKVGERAFSVFDNVIGSTVGSVLGVGHSLGSLFRR